MNFEQKSKKFKKGWYTCEVFNKIPTYWLVFEDIAANTNKINNSRLMLELFTELPDNSTVNAHLNNN